MQNRQNALGKWLKEIIHHEDYELLPITGDASFRRYFRLQYNGQSRVVMDAPPDKEALKPFIMIDELLLNAGLLAPNVYAYDEHLGFALLEDFGDRLFLKELTSNNTDALYSKALESLVLMQQCSPCSPYRLPLFDINYMFKELDLFKTWFLGQYLHISISPQDEKMMQETFEQLCLEIASQPQVFIHRDYHSRNLMLVGKQNQLGILDFQDAMLGPLTYDLVSLLKDCYIQLPQEQIKEGIRWFQQHAPLAQTLSLAALTRAFDLCGLQRHLKVLGIFSRLFLRDNKPNYLKDLPLTLAYTMACLESYEELKPFYEFMKTKVKLP